MHVIKSKQNLLTWMWRYYKYLFKLGGRLMRQHIFICEIVELTYLPITFFLEKISSMPKPRWNLGPCQKDSSTWEKDWRWGNDVLDGSKSSTWTSTTIRVRVVSISGPRRQFVVLQRFLQQQKWCRAGLIMPPSIWSTSVQELCSHLVPTSH